MKNQLGKIISWTQQNSTNELQTQALSCLKFLHDAIRVFDETDEDLCDGGEDSRGGEGAQPQDQDRGGALRCECREAIGEVAGHWHGRRYGPDSTSAFSLVVADASSGAGPVGSLFNDVLATHKEKIERTVTNFVDKMTKSAGMTRLQLVDNKPLKLDEIPALVCRRLLWRDCAPTVSPRDVTHDVGCISRELFCALAAHEHREELGQQRLGVVSHSPQPDGVSEKLG